MSRCIVLVGLLIAACQTPTNASDPAVAPTPHEAVRRPDLKAIAKYSRPNQGCPEPEASDGSWFAPRPTATAHEQKPGAATEVVLTWRNKIDYLPDPTRNGAMGAGITGQMFLFDDKLLPASAGGKLTIALYDETPRAPGQPAKPPEVWEFTKDVLKNLRSVDERWGVGYTLFLPWPAYRADVTRIRIAARFEPEHGRTLHAPDTRITFQKDEEWVTPAVAAAKPASPEIQSCEVKQATAVRDPLVFGPQSQAPTKPGALSGTWVREQNNAVIAATFTGNELKLCASAPEGDGLAMVILTAEYTTTKEGLVYGVVTGFDLAVKDGEKPSGEKELSSDEMRKWLHTLTDAPFSFRVKSTSIGLMVSSLKVGVDKDDDTATLLCGMYKPCKDGVIPTAKPVKKEPAGQGMALPRNTEDPEGAARRAARAGSVVPAAARPVPLQPWVAERMDQKYGARPDCRTPIMPPIREGQPLPICEDAPSDQEILRAMPRLPVGIPYFSEMFRDDIVIVKSRLVDKIDPPRFFPLVGPAQLHHCHWECVVYYTETVQSDYPFPTQTRTDRVQVLYINKDHLHLYDGKKEPAIAPPPRELSTMPIIAPPVIGFPLRQLPALPKDVSSALPIPSMLASRLPPLPNIAPALPPVVAVSGRGFEPPVAVAPGRTSIKFASPKGMAVACQQPSGKFNGDAKEDTFDQAKTYRLRLTNARVNDLDKAFYPTLEVAAASPKTRLFLEHACVPVTFTQDDFDHAVSGNIVVKVIYLPNPADSDFLVVPGPEEVNSGRLEPGVDPVAEAQRKGSILAIIRLGNGDLENRVSPAPSPMARAPMPTERPKERKKGKKRAEEDAARMQKLLDESEELRNIKNQWRRFWFNDRPSHLTPERIHGGSI